MYQVIARKYRPQTFSELIGQEHVQKTLTNAIASGRLAHGYIFSGQRGTGKTTVARILARCLNCIHGPTPNPCGVCSSCVEISTGSSVDVIEIDAASNRGINEMREIRENVRYRPARDRYKVFIIDEAHQITKEAFNALLKTLEEPPEWVVFILCTTEANEIPNTIVSRCQQFTFRSVDFAELMNRLRHIVAQEGIEADDETLSVIAQAGEGSVRDSLSALDQAIARCGRTLGVAEIRALLGLFGTESLRAVAEALQANDGNRMLEIAEELERGGQSLQHFCRELSRYWRNLLVAKIIGKPTRLIAASDREQEGLLETANAFSEEDLTRYL
ncbi:MAG: DNA polymerase III subunit gamma/tau, partial [Acidobacteriaceae bacterium]|nr:DNA polymerase III subunit gamma/tau [Acidobacteriaceae bacterium]MBV9938613.1 DNA polymerase III subunit gamma/tau [Acidobacteriaceae bacterium]